MKNKKGERLQVRVEVLTQKEQKWYLGREPKETLVKLRVTNDGWFPMKVIAGVSNRRFSEDAELSRKNGWVEGSGNLGSRTVLVKKGCLSTCIKTLKENGVNIKAPVISCKEATFSDATEDDIDYCELILKSVKLDYNRLFYESMYKSGGK